MDKKITSIISYNALVCDIKEETDSTFNVKREFNKIIKTDCYNKIITSQEQLK